MAYLRILRDADNQLIARIIHTATMAGGETSVNVPEVFDELRVFNQTDTHGRLLQPDTDYTVTDYVVTFTGYTPQQGDVLAFISGTLPIFYLQRVDVSSADPQDRTVKEKLRVEPVKCNLENVTISIVDLLGGQGQETGWYSLSEDDVTYTTTLSTALIEEGTPYTFWVKCEVPQQEGQVELTTYRDVYIKVDAVAVSNK